MKVLITGGLGQLGIELSKQLQARTDIKDVYCISHEMLDIVSKKDIQKVLERYQPDIVINCAAYTAVDLCEEYEDKAYRVNTLGTKYLAQVCNQIDTKFVHISTDYVFSGHFNISRELNDGGCFSSVLEFRKQQANKSKPWIESDKVAPQNIYGKSKLAGEEAVRKYCQKHFILRTAWLYGEGNNFVRTMLKLAQTNKELNVVGDQYGTPTYTKDLARVIIQLMQTEYYGTYHATCEGMCSWYDFALEIFRIKDMAVKVNKVTSEQFVRPAKRPKYTVLENAHLKERGLNTFRPWKEALADYLEADAAWQEENLGGKVNGKN